MTVPDHEASHARHAQDEHGHSHGLIHEDIMRSRAGIRAVSLSLAVLGVAAAAQTLVFLASGSIALLAAIAVALGAPIADPLIGVAITLVILRITLQSWRSIRGDHSH